MRSNTETLCLITDIRTHLGGSDAQFSTQLLPVNDSGLPNQNGLITVNSKPYKHYKIY